MKKKYQAPSKEFFRLPNNIFDLRLTPIQFTIYAYLISRSGSKGYCWPTHETIVRDTGIGKTSVQEALKILKKRQIISVSKHRKPYGWIFRKSYSIVCATKGSDYYGKAQS